MQENEFEAAVNHQMEGFGIEPSAQVWTEVERRIRKDKKRRFAIWYWFLLLFLAGGILTAVLFNQQDNNSTVVATTLAQKNIKETNSSPDIKNTASLVIGKNEHTESSKKDSVKQESTDDESNTNSEKERIPEKKKSLPLIFINEGNLESKIMLPTMEGKVEN